MIEDAIWEDPEKALGLNLGFADIHLQSADPELDMLKEIVHKNKAEASAFVTKESGIRNIQDAVFFEINKVLAWLTEKRKNFDNPRDYHELILDVYMQEETGILLNNKLQEFATDSVRVVLRRDYNNTEYGFRVDTAYPIITKEPQLIRVLNRRDIANKIDFVSKLQKIAFLTNGENDINASYMQTSAGEDCIRYDTHQQNELYVAYLKPETFSIYRKSDGTNEKVSPEQLEERCPKMAEVLKDALFYQVGGISIEESLEDILEVEEMDPITEEQI